MIGLLLHPEMKKIVILTKIDHFIKKTVQLVPKGTLVVYLDQRLGA